MPDVSVIGGGVVGLAAAVALADAGHAVTLFDARRRGEASAAAAGMLAPGVEHAEGAAQDFAVAGRERYASYVDMLRERTGVDVPPDRAGILHVVADAAEAESRRGSLGAEAEWLDSAELARVEPALAPAAGAVLHAHDGAVDNVILLEALRRLVRSLDRVAVQEERVTGVRWCTDGSATVLGASGSTVACGRVVLAAGTWVNEIRGLPRPLPVRPARGQMIALAAAPVHHVTYAPAGYVVPRGTSRSVVGATMEYVGFDPSAPSWAAAPLERAAAAIAPVFARARRLDHWSGLRPVTPDLLPIIGADPEQPSLIYACGHSRNGILLAPVTGDVVAKLASDGPAGFDLAPFSVARFSAPG